MSPTSFPWPQPTSASASYSLQCHCAAIQFSIKLSPPLLESEAQGEGVYTAIECDCTHCETKGILACHPKVGDLKWEAGREVRLDFLNLFFSLFRRFRFPSLWGYCFLGRRVFFLLVFFLSLVGNPCGRTCYLYSALIA